jgi:hypothetical protein
MKWSIAVIGGVILLPGMRKYLFPAEYYLKNMERNLLDRHEYIKDGSSVIKDDLVVVEGVRPSAVESKI